MAGSTALLDDKQYTERTIRVSRACTFCTKPIAKGHISWQRGHNVLHRRCFKQLQDAEK